MDLNNISMDLDGFRWTCMVLYVFSWICMDLYVFTCIYMDLYGLNWVYIDLRRFGRDFIIIGLEVGLPVAGCGNKL